MEYLIWYCKLSTKEILSFCSKQINIDENNSGLPSKRENLSCEYTKLIHMFAKNYHLHWIAGRANNL